MAELKRIVKKLSELNMNIIPLADIKEENIRNIDEASLIQKIIELKDIELEKINESETNKEKIEKKYFFLDNKKILEIIKQIKSEKIPKPIEIIKNTSFKSTAIDIKTDFKIYNQDEKIEKIKNIDDFTNYFRNRLKKIREQIITKPHHSFLDNMERIKNYMSGREIEIIGIVTKKIITKKNNIFVEIEDETYQAKIIFINSSEMKLKELFKEAGALVNDEVIGIKGRISNQFIIANEIIKPPIKIHEIKKLEDNFSVAFISDIHAGSKLFLENNFIHMLKWIEGGTNKDIDIVKKLKYIIIGGDAVDGIGIYPHQEKDLAILDIYQQYSMLFNLLNVIPDYIHIFILPGNHDATQRAEPQPALDESITKDFKKDNIHFIRNPSFLTLNGLNILSYHGTSLDSIIASVPNMSYLKPETAMIELLKRRHLSPIYGGNIIVPGLTDDLVIDKIPDILHMGHIHKNGLTEYKGIKILNSGTWQDKTEFQIRQGHIPTPCQLPIYDTGSNNFKILNFS